MLAYRRGFKCYQKKKIEKEISLITATTTIDLTEDDMMERVKEELSKKKRRIDSADVNYEFKDHQEIIMRFLKEKIK